MADSPALRIVARGISCRDCIWFYESLEGRPMCDGEISNPTAVSRELEGLCGPEAKWFEPIPEVDSA